MEIDSGDGEVWADDLQSGEERPNVISAKSLDGLRQMVNNPFFSDVVFKCKDLKRVHGSRMILASKSTLLKDLLTECPLSEINLSQISSPALLSVFEFLYTGTLFDYQPQNWSMAFELRSVSLMFELPELEIITQEFANSFLDRDLPKATSVLTEALGSLNL